MKQKEGLNVCVQTLPGGRIIETEQTSFVEMAGSKFVF